MTPNVTYNENDIIHAIAQGSRKACNELYNRHVIRLFRFLRQYSNDIPQVEDWVQRAFIKAFTKIGSFNGRSCFSTWLFTIALNEMRSDMRRTPIIIFDSSDLKEERFCEDLNTEFEWHEEMKSMLADLDPTKRTVFLLFEIEGYSHSEIAMMLNISGNVSRTILYRTKQILKKKWDTIKDAV